MSYKGTLMQAPEPGRHGNKLFLHVETSRGGLITFDASLLQGRQEFTAYVAKEVIWICETNPEMPWAALRADDITDTVGLGMVSSAALHAAVLSGDTRFIVGAALGIMHNWRFLLGGGTFMIWGAPGVDLYTMDEWIIPTPPHPATGITIHAAR
jgi:hypothetical protein